MSHSKQVACKIKNLETRVTSVLETKLLLFLEL